MNNLGVASYKFRIAEPQDFDRILNLMVTYYPIQNPFAIVFDIPPIAFQMKMAPLLKAKVYAGKCFIAVDQGT